MSDSTTKRWLAIARERSVVLRALKVSALVGTVLVLINHFDTLVQGEVNRLVIAKMLLTYLVPYSVATYAAVEAIRSRVN